MRQLFLSSLVLVVFTSTASLSQIVSPYYEVGYFTDADRQPIDGYIDVTYQPKTRSDHQLTLGESFTPGCYYNLKREKINGRIKYGYKDGFFRFTPPSGGDKSEKITADMCLSYVIGKDSFAVIKDFTVERELLSELVKEPTFAEVITTVGDLTFYQHTVVGQNKLLYTYIVKEGKGPLVSFPKSKNKFKEVALTCFGHIPYLSAGISNETMGDEDVLNMIKYYEYSIRLKDSAKIYYSASWEELKDTSEYGYLYYADSLCEKNGVWSMRYYVKDGTPLYSGSYSSLAPQKKDGLFTFYFPDGRLRKTVTYRNNETFGDIKSYQHNGLLHYVYTKRNFSKPEYRVVADASGKNVLDPTGSGTETFYDSIQSREITRIYKNYKLTDSYYLDASGAPVYQSAKNHAAVWNKEALENNELIKPITYPKIAISNNVHGMILVKVLADREGNTAKVMLVKGLDYECDKTVMSYCQSKYKGKNWYPLKIDKETVAQEILMVFVMEIIPYSRYRNNYYYNNMWYDHYMLQQHMNLMQQQQTMPQVPRF